MPGCTGLGRTLADEIEEREKDCELVSDEEEKTENEGVQFSMQLLLHALLAAFEDGAEDDDNDERRREETPQEDDCTAAAFDAIVMCRKGAYRMSDEAVDHALECVKDRRRKVKSSAVKTDKR